MFLCFKKIPNKLHIILVKKKFCPLNTASPKAPPTGMKLKDNLKGTQLYFIYFFITPSHKKQCGDIADSYPKTMRNSRALIIIVFATLLSMFLPAVTSRAGDNTLTFMWWNVENLFDTKDDPATEDSEFTPEGGKRWTSKKLLLKYMRLSHIIKIIRLKTGSYPEILVLGEVENRAVFDRLLSFLPDNAYKTAYHASNDPRGIDIALAYDSTRVSLENAISKQVDFKGKNTRDITLYSFSGKGSTFFLLVNHWPSRALGKAWSEPQRLLAAKTAKSIIDSLKHQNSFADIIVMGDFNDEPHDRSVREILNATDDKKKFMKNQEFMLFSCWNETDEKGSCFFMGRWLKFDQIMVSHGLFDNKGLHMPENAFSCFSIPHMHAGNNGRPYATYKGLKYLGGYSDHFPVLLHAEIR